VAQEGGLISVKIQKMKKNHCLVKIFNQTLIDPEMIFNRDHNRDYAFKIGIRFEKRNHGSNLI